MTIAKGTLLEVKEESTGEWILARVEFRIERGEPLGSYSFYREGGGGRIVQCLCKTREPKNRGVVKWGVWCVEDQRFCDKTIGTEEHARAELPRWQSGERSDLKPDHGFHYEVCEVKWTASGPEPLLLGRRHECPRESKN